MNTNKNIKPFVKWAGGKRQFIEKLMPIIPKYKRYIEPFLGGGAMLFALQPKDFIANDINFELITTYKVLTHTHTQRERERERERELESLLEQIDEYGNNHSKEFYNKIRELQPNDLSEIGIAARFIYLNKGGFNGLYRLNKDGKFNVPWNSSPNTKFYDLDSLIETSKYLSNSKGKFYNLDYKKILSKAKEGDFIFVDPPYDESFTGYTSKGFDTNDQKELAKILKELTNKGVKWILCNYDTPLIRELYKGNNRLLLEATRSISSDSSKRKGVFKEVFYYNYGK